MPNTDAQSLPRNYIVVFEMRSTRPTAALERALREIGPSYQVNRTVWLIQADGTLGSIRNSLTPCLGAGDTLLIVDVAEGRRAAFGFGPSDEARLRAVWAKSTEIQAD